MGYGRANGMPACFSTFDVSDSGNIIGRRHPQDPDGGRQPGQRERRHVHLLRDVGGSGARRARVAERRAGRRLRGDDARAGDRHAERDLQGDRAADGRLPPVRDCGDRRDRRGGGLPDDGHADDLRRRHGLHRGFRRRRRRPRAAPTAAPAPGTGGAGGAAAATGGAGTRGAATGGAAGGAARRRAGAGGTDAAPGGSAAGGASGGGAAAGRLAAARVGTDGRRRRGRQRRRRRLQRLQLRRSAAAAHRRERPGCSPLGCAAPAAAHARTRDMRAAAGLCQAGGTAARCPTNLVSPRSAPSPAPGSSTSPPRRAAAGSTPATRPGRTWDRDSPRPGRCRARRRAWPGRHRRRRSRVRAHPRHLGAARGDRRALQPALPPRHAVPVHAPRTSASRAAGARR